MCLVPKHHDSSQGDLFHQRDLSGPATLGELPREDGELRPRGQEIGRAFLEPKGKPQKTFRPLELALLDNLVKDPLHEHFKLPRPRLGQDVLNLLIVLEPGVRQTTDRRPLVAGSQDLGDFGRL